MSTDRPEIDLAALSAVLDEARLRVDDAVSKLGPAAGIGRLRGQLQSALADNNTSCNTACSCGGGGGGGGSQGGGTIAAAGRRE